MYHQYAQSMSNDTLIFIHTNVLFNWAYNNLREHYHIYRQIYQISTATANNTK